MLLTTAAFPAYADFKVTHDLPKTKLNEKPIGTSKEPVTLEASRVDYDQNADIVIATGNVQIVQGSSIVLADQVTYDQDKDEVTATGHVSMLEPSGNVYFADTMTLHDDFKAGVIHAFKARLVDDSRMVANGARRIDENHMELFKAVYTPCLCDVDNKPKTPTWQINAAHAVIDQQEQEVRYDNAFFDFYGTPIFYTPYFSHATPGADNQSGLLMPSFMHSDNIGQVYKQPVYYSIAPDKDLTLTPIYTSLAGPVMAADYRQMFNSGQFDINGSLTSAPNRDAAGNPISGHEYRGNINAVGEFKIDKNDDWGFDIHRATDDTYMRLYNFSNDILLTSRIYAESFAFTDDNDRSYASIQGLSFQGLTGQDDAKIIPVVAPLTDVTWQSNPGWYNSRVMLTGDAMALYRQTGAQSRRLSGSADWKLPYISDDGEELEFHAGMRTDLYDVSQVQLADGRNYAGITGREIPEVSMMWRYPFIDRWDNGSLTLEPIVEFDASPGGGNPSKIPNEDSQVPEFTDANLFSPDRFAGLDRVENGPRVSYGVRSQAQLWSDIYVDTLVGQHYRTSSDASFPFSNDPTSHLSDYVGRVAVTSDPLTVAYRFRLDKQTLAANRSEVDTSMNLYPLMFNVSYLSLKNDPILSDKQVVTGSTALSLTKNWIWNVSGSRDLQLGQTTATTTGFTFKNECVSLTTMIGKDYTTLLDVKPSLNFWVTVSLKNLE